MSWFGFFCHLVIEIRFSAKFNAFKSIKFSPSRLSPDRSNEVAITSKLWKFGFEIEDWPKFRNNCCLSHAQNPLGPKSNHVGPFSDFGDFRRRDTSKPKNVAKCSGFSGKAFKQLSKLYTIMKNGHSLQRNLASKTIIRTKKCWVSRLKFLKRNFQIILVVRQKIWLLLKWFSSENYMLLEFSMCFIPHICWERTRISSSRWKRPNY